MVCSSLKLYSGHNWKNVWQERKAAIPSKVLNIILSTENLHSLTSSELLIKCQRYIYYLLICQPQNEPGLSWIQQCRCALGYQIKPDNYCVLCTISGSLVSKYSDNHLVEVSQCKHMPTHQTAQQHIPLAPVKCPVWNVVMSFIIITFPSTFR